MKEFKSNIYILVLTLMTCIKVLLHHLLLHFNDLYKSTFTPSRLKQLETRTWLYQDYRLETVTNMLAK